MKDLVKQLLLGSVLMAGVGYTIDTPTVPAVKTNKPQQPLTSEQKTSLATEQEKWHYLRGQLSFEVGEIKSLSRSVGAVINGIKLPLSLLGGFGGTALLGGVILGHRDVTVQEIFMSPVFAFITYHVLKDLSDFFEDKPYVCMQALEKFLHSWPTVHKALSPQAVWAMFDALYADAQQNDGELTIIDEEQAKKIVEGVIATALLVEVVRV